jgi:hypothetical protein
MNNDQQDGHMPDVNVQDSNDRAEEIDIYCDACFLALGSQEKRVNVDSLVFHTDCAVKRIRASS